MKGSLIEAPEINLAFYEQCTFSLSLALAIHSFGVLLRFFEYSKVEAVIQQKYIPILNAQLLNTDNKLTFSNCRSHLIYNSFANIEIYIFFTTID